MERISVYTKDNCVQCRATERAMEKENLVWDEYDMMDMPNKVMEFRDEGLLQAPVVEVGHERWAGFQPDKIKELGKRALDGTIDVSTRD